MRSCSEYQELISRLLDEDLSADEQAELERHVSGCAECRAMLDAFRSLSGALAEDLEEVPAGLHESIMADARREALRRRQAPKRVRRFLAMAACAALVILAAAANLPKLQHDAAMLAAPKEAASGETAYLEAADETTAEAPAEEPAEAEPAASASDRGEQYAADDAAAYAGAVEEPNMPEPKPEPVPESEAALPAEAMPEPEPGSLPILGYELPYPEPLPEPYNALPAAAAPEPYAAAAPDPDPAPKPAAIEEAAPGAAPELYAAPGAMIEHRVLFRVLFLIGLPLSGAVVLLLFLKPWKKRK